MFWGSEGKRKRAHTHTIVWVYVGHVKCTRLSLHTTYRLASFVALRSNGTMKSVISDATYMCQRFRTSTHHIHCACVIVQLAACLEQADSTASHRSGGHMWMEWHTAQGWSCVQSWLHVTCGLALCPDRPTGQLRLSQRMFMRTQVARCTFVAFWAAASSVRHSPM